MPETHYTPDINDIRVGYKFQWNETSKISGDGTLIEDWDNCTIRDTEDFANLKIAIEDGSVRTKYLTIEDIVELGWDDEGPMVPQEGVITDKPVNLRKFNRGNKYIMIYDFSAKVAMIAISINDIFSVCIQRYDCPSVNELTYILSKLNLK